MKRNVMIVALVVMAGVLAGRVDLWSSSVKPSSPMRAVAQAAPSPEAEAIQAAFIRIGRQVGPAVVSISTEQPERVREFLRGHPFFGGDESFDDFFRQFQGAPQQPQFSLGSGVIIDERGFILTNEHVVADGEKISVTLSDGRKLTGTVKGKDPRSDLAVVKIDAKNLTAAPLGDSASVVTGQWAIALGNPFGLMGFGPSVQTVGAEPTLTVGVVSALNRQLPKLAPNRDYSDLIQTDAAINPGNSGGPLLNLQGEVIGINVAILSSSRGFEGVGFAIPINKAKAILEALIAGKPVIYGWLGVQIQDITEDVAEFYGLKDRTGVVVYQVLPDSPASKAGLKDGDILKSFNGEPVQHSRQLIDLVSRTKAGAKTKLEILRDGKPQTVEIAIGERPSDGELAGGPTADSWRGVHVVNAADQAGRMNLPPGALSGVMVMEVDDGSPAEQAGLQPGDIINEINRLRIENVSDYRTAIAQIKGNALVRTNRGYVVIKAGE